MSGRGPGSRLTPFTSRLRTRSFCWGWLAPFFLSDSVAETVTTVLAHSCLSSGVSLLSATTLLSRDPRAAGPAARMAVSGDLGSNKTISEHRTESRDTPWRPQNLHAAAATLHTPRRVCGTRASIHALRLSCGSRRLSEQRRPGPRALKRLYYPLAVKRQALRLALPEVNLCCSLCYSLCCGLCWRGGRRGGWRGGRRGNRRGSWRGGRRGGRRRCSLLRLRGGGRRSAWPVSPLRQLVQVARPHAAAEAALRAVAVEELALSREQTAVHSLAPIILSVTLKLRSVSI